MADGMTKQQCAPGPAPSQARKPSCLAAMMSSVPSSLAWSMHGCQDSARRKLGIQSHLGLSHLAFSCSHPADLCTSERSGWLLIW